MGIARMFRNLARKRLSAALAGLALLAMAALQDGFAATTARVAITLQIAKPGGYTLSVQSTPITGVSIGSSTGHGGLTNYSLAVKNGVQVTLNAPSADPVGYTFVRWRLNSDEQGMNKKALSFLMAAPSTAVAEYKLTPCILNVQSTPIQKVAISSPTGQGGPTNYSMQDLPWGTPATLVAPASDPAKYVFVRWTLGGIAQPAGRKTISLVMNATMITAIAQYQLVTYPLSIQSTPVTGVTICSTSANGGATNCRQDVAADTQVYLRAPTGDPCGYVFADWRLNGTAQAPGQKVLCFTLTGPTTAVAEYRPAQGCR
jgi:hypothetical protein